MQLFSAIFYVVKAVQKFDSRRVINETPHKWRSRKEDHAVTQANIFDKIYSNVFPRP
jgi:hypothetical protein